MINKYAITSEIYEEIPAFIDGVWTTISYNSREEFALDLEQNYFKEVGEYNLTEDAHKVLEVRKIKLKTGEYCDEPYNTAKYVEFWDFEKLKSRKGVFIHSGENKWYFSRDLYFWWNFLAIFNKKKKADQFPDLIDAHIRMDLYELIAELKYKHSVITKKRQFGSSYYHMAKLINRFWFEPSVVLQMGASLEKYIDDKDGCWKYINSYKNYLNKETAWFRHIDGGAKGPWQQKKKEIDPITKQETESGRMGTLGAFTFERSATNGVGGPKTIFYHEESGIAPKMDTTYGFISPALEDGVYTTGSFIAAGSVGDLTQCEPLKKYMYSPEQNNFYGVLNKWVGENEPAIITGLYIAEFHGMAGFVDQWGNSLVEEAFAYLKELKEKYAVEKTPEDYALFCSQKPTYLNEAFKYRGESSYPTLLLQSEELRLTTEEKVYEVLDTEYDPDDEKGQNILLIPTTRVPISVFPLSPLTKDKSGAVVIFERPIQNLQPLVTYYASVDPVGQGKAEHVDNKVYTPKGLKRFGDLKIGDLVIGSNGKSCKVTGVFPQGRIDLYDVKFNDGFSLKVGEEHLWKVYPNPAGDKINGHVFSTKQLLDKSLKVETLGTGRNSKKKYKTPTYFKNPNNSFRWQIPITEPIIFIKNKIPLDPYLVGVLLGDGGLSQRSVYFSTKDLEILDYISKVLPEGVTIKFDNRCTYRLSTSTPGKKNPLTQKLRSLDLMGKKSIDKFIPKCYLHSSVENRLLLLQGLLDTDGYSGNSSAEFYSISKKLAYNVVTLVQSIGGIATIRKKITKVGVGFVYIVRIKLPKPFNPFRLKRKAEKYKMNCVFSRYISEINYCGKGEAICISVDSQDHLYVSENAIVTHNTLTSKSLASIYIYRRLHMVTRVVNGIEETVEEGDKIVATWCGRYDDIEDTHEEIIKLILLYKAWTLVENNVSLLIDEIKRRNLQKYLVPKKQFQFGTEFQSQSQGQFFEYGWRNTGDIFSRVLESYLLKWLNKIIYKEFDDDGNITKMYRGVRRLNDVMAIKEMLAYYKGLNVDRIVTLAALVTFVDLQEAHKRGAMAHVHQEDVTEKLQIQNKLTILSNKQIFSNLGNKKVSNQSRGKSIFKKLR